MGLGQRSHSRADQVVGLTLGEDGFRTLDSFISFV